jgi:cellulose synthase/poly-beta-1,6-N-acetylglucosamine synthase-like glycosyltransferase
VNTDDSDAWREIDALVARVGDDRVRVVSSADLRSASHARNVGLRAAPADADLIAFCDGDDVVDDGWLQALIDALGDHAAVGGQLIDVYPNPRQANWRPPATPGALPAFLGVPYIVTANMIITREAFEAVGGFDTELVRCEDIAISWALLKAGYTIGYAPDATVQYRHRPGLWLLLRQHELYGQGMAQVLARYGLPTGDTWEAPRGVALLRPNGQRAARRSMVGTLRRVALGVGRVHGIVSERLAG